jgi:RHS repeat-associated protein
MGGGEFRYSEQLLSLGGLIPLDFTLLYAPDLQFNRTPLNSGRTQFPPHDVIRGFTSNTIIRIVCFDDRCDFKNYINVFLQGDTLIFVEDDGGNYIPKGPQKFQIKQVGDYYYMMDPYQELVYIFRSRDVGSWESRCQYTTKEGELIYILGRNNNSLSYTYNLYNLPTKIEDGLGRRLDMGYISTTSLQKNHISSLSDGYGRTISFAYEECGNDEVLASFTDPMGNTTTFDYDETKKDCTLIEKINHPLGNSHIDQTWTENPRGVDAIESQKDAYGNETTFGYVLGANEIITTVTSPDGLDSDFHHKNDRYPLDATDPSGNQSTMEYNSDDQMTSITDRTGGTTSCTYHTGSGKIASITDAEGGLITYTYAAQDQTFTNPDNSDEVTFTFYNLTRIDYPDVTNEQYAYDDNGNVLTRTDRAGKTWTYAYDSLGNVLIATNPTGGILTNTYNSDGTMASYTDTDTGTTTYGYDQYKRLNLVTHPDGSNTQMAYNLNGQITSITDGNNNTCVYEYDANGNLEKEIDPSNQETLYASDLMDRVTQVTDSMGKISIFGYDSMGRLASVTNRNNIQTTHGYDPGGWRNSTTLGGKTWNTGYDDEGVVSSKTTPLGHTTTYQTNKLGDTTGITNPLGQTTSFTRDAMGRVTGVTDPMGRITNYSYNARGTLSGVTLPVVGSAGYQCNDLGLLSRITDLNGQGWVFSYTAMGRVQSQTDPLGNIWQYTQGQRGRLTQTTYPDGATLTRTYDNAGNLTRTLYSDGTDLQYTYNSLDSLESADGLNLSRDAEDRVTDTQTAGASFEATYDDGGRLKTAAYNNGAFTVTYTYDATTGLLSRVTDNLTLAQVDFAYDSDLKLSSITRSNGVNTTFVYDNAGRLIRTMDGSIIDIQYNLDAAGQVIQANMTVPLDPSGLLTAGADSFTHDAASRVSSAGYAYDPRGRLSAAPGHTYSWDGASRLTGIDGVTLTYNGLDDLLTRTQGGKTTGYYYNYAIGMRPIVGEQDKDGGQFLRYYVWTPGGALLYMIDAEHANAVCHYHFDRTGSTLALTDSTGAVTDSYAYTTYGRMLQHNGSIKQPFTFVGKWGVRQEGTGGDFYQMRARYFHVNTGMFTSKEPLWPVISDPRLINPYQYALNDPVGKGDMTGTFPIPSEVIDWPPPPIDIPAYQGNYVDDTPDVPNRERNKLLDMAKKLGLDHLGNLPMDKLKEMIKQKLLKEIQNKLARELGEKAAKEAMKALAKKANVALLLYDGGVAIHELYTWATADNAGELMQQTLSYQLVEALEEIPAAQTVIQAVGSVVSWLLGD